MEQFYKLATEAVCAHFKVKSEEGLTTGEAKERLIKYGYNQLIAKGKKGRILSGSTEDHGGSLQRSASEWGNHKDTIQSTGSR